MNKARSQKLELATTWCLAMQQTNGVERKESRVTVMGSQGKCALAMTPQCCCYDKPVLEREEALEERQEWRSKDALVMGLLPICM